MSCSWKMVDIIYVATLALGLRAKPRLARVRAKREAREGGRL
jgi:hypothetical protein